MSAVPTFLEALAGVRLLASPSISLPYLTSGLFNRDPLIAAVSLCAWSIFACWVLSVVTGNCSWVDRLWSVIPAVYAGLFARAPLSSLFSGRALDSHEWRLMGVWLLIAIWGSRLTFNFARKGGYRFSYEDYRWEVLRSMMNAFCFQIFNLVFIAVYQNVLLLGITLPIYVASLSRAPFNQIDALALCGLACCIVGEAVADQQQWNFHVAKHALIAAGKARTGDDAGAFLWQGLFRYSRHPNYFFEISSWWCVYLVCVGASGVWLHWSIAGAVLLTLLFQGSTAFAETLSAKKYPHYAKYQAAVSRLIPWFPRSAPVECKRD